MPRFPIRSVVTLLIAAVGGVAWHQHTGISAVEVSLDGGPWQPMELGRVPSDDTWVQWSIPWNATDAGQHTIRCRATNVNGETQTSDQAPPAPNGATGWHTIIANVA